VDGAGHPLVTGCPPEWASGWGQDRHGVFVEFRVGGVTQRMRWIPPGEFMMGSPPEEKERYSNEDQHRVTLTHGYWLGDTPVTQALWLAVMGENPSHFQGEPRRPVEQASWEDCQHFCARLGARVQGLTCRLPTEAEWEYACRAGTRDARYGELDAVAWYAKNSGGETHLVKLKAANPWGLFDMLGNVWEWCSDWYSQYSRAAQRDPAGAAAGALRVMRGGSWGHGAGDVRAAYRGADPPGFRYASLGLRLARDQDE